MTLVLPAVRRSAVSDRGLGLEILIPSRLQIASALFALVWLGGWAVGEVSAIQTLFCPSPDPGGMAFLAFWLSGWTLAGAYILLWFFWMLVGRERISISPSSIMIRREIGRFGLTRKYRLSDVKNLRSVPASPLDDWDNLVQFWRDAVGLIAFNYGAKTVRFGHSIEEAEASILVGEVRQRYPSL